MELSRDTKLFIGQMRLDAKFRSVMRDLAGLRPVVPAWKPGTNEETEELMERIKYESGRKDGFDIIYMTLTGERPDE